MAGRASQGSRGPATASDLPRCVTAGMAHATLIDSRLRAGRRSIPACYRDSGGAGQALCRSPPAPGQPPRLRSVSRHLANKLLPLRGDRNK